MRIAATLAAVGMAMTLGGCSTLSSLNPFSSKTSRNPPAPLVDFTPRIKVRTAWSTNVGKSANYVFSPASARDGIYAAAADGTIVRVDASTGAIAWRINSGTRLTAGVGSDGFSVAVGAANGMLLVYDSSGKLRWKTQLSSEILSAPAVGEGVVVVRSVDNRIVAFDAESGTRRWSVQRTSPPLILRSTPGILIAAQTAYVGLPGGRLLALALSNGGPRWEAAVGDPRGATELERIADVSGTPVMVGRDICAVAYQGRVACFDVITGAGRWSKDLSSDAGVGADDRSVFAVDERGTVYAFTLETGVSIWRNNKLANRRLSTPVSLGRALAVGDGQGYMHFLSPDDGSFLARNVSDGSAIIAAPVAAGAGVVFQTQAGALVALAIE